VKEAKINGENACRQAGTLRINTVFPSRQSVKHEFGIK
jgi:hypothetical protein